MRPVAIANRHPHLSADRRAIVRLIRTLDTHHGELAQSGTVLENDGELSVVFLTDPALAAIHADFLQDPTPTDVITFEGNPTLGTAGEICVSVDAALRECANRKSARSSSDNFARELTLYIVHGWLHLAGYDDLVPAKKRAMRRAEQRALRLLTAHSAMPRLRVRPGRRK